MGVVVGEEELDVNMRVSVVEKTSSMELEQVPELKVGAMLRIKPQGGEVFSRRRDGIVFSEQWFTVVEGGMGDNIRPFNISKGENMTWG